MLRIGEFSALSHTSVKTLRFYDGVGVLRPACVDRYTHYRYYAPAQIVDIAVIRRLRGLGMSLAEIRRLRQNLASTSHLHDALLQKRRELASQVEEDERRLADLDAWVKQLSGGTAARANPVMLKRLAACTVAVIRKSIATYEEAAALFDELRHHARRRGSQHGARAAIWHTCGDVGDRIDCEAFIAARQDFASTPHIRVCARPACLVAAVVHQGRIDTSSSPYDAARAWIASHGYRVTGPKREIYWAGQVEANDDSDVTEIQFPIARV
jgi:DNA-binding transcriptional MerR regulator